MRFSLQTRQSKDYHAICSPRQIYIKPQQYPHLQELDLADTSASKHLPDKVDMLIGSDFYWDYWRH